MSATSLPYAWSVVADVAAGAAATPADFADHATPPPSEAERGQLLRALASDAIRGGLERHFGVKLAFQNCHRVAAFRAGDGGRRRVPAVRLAAAPRSATSRPSCATADHADHGHTIAAAVVCP